jgi:AraC-like DNA-binding protein
MIKEDNQFINLEYVVKSTLNHCHFRIHNVYNLSHHKNWRINHRKIHDWMLVYARGGRGYYQIDGTKHWIEEGKIFFISNDMFHNAAQEELFPVSVIAIRFGLYDNISNQLLAEELPPWGFSCKTNRFSYYHQLFENIYTYYKIYPEDISTNFCHVLLCRIFNLLYINMFLTYHENSPNKRLEEAKLFIEENLLADLSLNKVAEHVQLSPKYFSKLFRQHFNFTYKKYLLTVKMNYAKLLLEETNDSIKRIALLLGYSDQYIFSNQFKSMTGISPAKFRSGTKLL